MKVRRSVPKKNSLGMKLNDGSYEIVTEDAEMHFETPRGAWVKLTKTGEIIYRKNKDIIE